jgi:hypothetical protein
MRVVDPIANVEREFEACHTLKPIGDYIPVESLVPGQWYAVYAPTFTTRTLPQLPLEEQQDVWFAIDALSDAPLDEVSPLVEAFASPVAESIYDKHILKAIFVLGSGGAGKGVVIDAMFPGTGLKVINADAHFERFLKSAKIPMSDAGKEYALFSKARDLRDKELRHYAGRRLGIVIDMTGWAYDRVAVPVKKLRELGYDTYAVFVDVGLNTAMRRNIQRANAGGRDVPDSFVKDAWYGSQRHAGDYVKLFGLKNFFTIDNDKDLAPQVWGRVVGTQAAKIGRKILTRPLRNPEGIAWIKKQLDAETADYNDPKAPTPWPAPVEEPVGTLAAKYLDEPKSKSGSVAAKYPPKSDPQKPKGSPGVTNYNPKVIPLPDPKAKKPFLPPKKDIKWPKMPPPKGTNESEEDALLLTTGVEKYGVNKGLRFVTGKAVTFEFLHNREKSPDFGTTFKQHLEPAGMFVTTLHDPEFASRINKDKPGHYERGTATLLNPLVLKSYSDGTKYDWKDRVSAFFGGKTKKVLSRALMKAGYDGVVTVSNEGEPGEVVLLNPAKAIKAGSVTQETK